MSFDDKPGEANGFLIGATLGAAIGSSPIPCAIEPNYSFLKLSTGLVREALSV